MNRKITLISIVFLSFFFVPFVFADQEAPNVTFVQSSKYGSIYAKSVPDDILGIKGKTFVYLVGKESDKLLYTFDWFAHQIYLLDSSGSVVRLGPWARGHQPNKEDLAIGFYLNGKKVKEYSTLDIVEMGYDEEINVRMSVSHYTVFEEIIGYRWIRHNIWVFDVKTHEGKILSFDTSTGELRSQEQEKHDKIIRKIQDLKIGCYAKSSQLAKEDEYKHILTIEEFEGCVGDRAPQTPEGYELYLGSFFDEVKLEKIE